MIRRHLVLLVPLGGILLTQPFVGRSLFDGESEQVEATEAQDARGALEWRAKTLRGPDGAIRPDGLSRAHDQVQLMRQTAATSPAAQMAAAAQLSRGGWRWLGPGNIGGRVRALVANPANPDTLFAGGIAGGIWRTDDGGDSWWPVDDFMANLAVSALVINPRNPTEMYAGTGEVYYNYDQLHGGGIFKSTDGGVTWSLLPATDPAADDRFFLGVSRLAMTPDGSTLLASAGGYVYRTTNGGATFTRSTQSGFIDVDIDPNNGSNAVGVGYSGLGYYSHDGGVTWLTSGGVPTTAPPGRLEVTYARSQPNLVYMATADGRLFVSTNGGASYSARFSGLSFSQGWYNLTLWINPRDANHILLGAEQLYESTNGGVSFRQIGNGLFHTDQHVIVEDPRFDNAANRTIFIGNDGGVYRTDANRGGTYAFEARNNNLGITQFYAAAGNASTGHIVGGTQDNGTVLYQPESGTTWISRLGGDGGFAAFDQTDSNVFYMEMQYLQIYRSTAGSNDVQISGGIPDAGTGNAGFIAPFILDPNNSLRMLAGGASLWRSDDVKTAATPSWTSIKSPGNDGVISAIAVAQGTSDVIWLGHEGGAVTRTLNGTATAPAWSRMYQAQGGVFVTRVTIDPNNFNTVYVSLGGFTKPNIVRTDDGGVTWVDATGSGATALPTAPVRDVEVDLFDPATIYAGTEVGLFVSHDRGATWTLPQDGPANVSVDELFWMGSTLVAATHGRGLFAEDLNPPGTETISVSPGRLDFGARTQGTTSSGQHVTITNTGTAPVTIQAVRMMVAGDKDSFFPWNTSSCVNSPLPPGGVCGFDAYFAPVQTGPLSAVIEIMSTAPGSPDDVVVSGTGQPANTLPAPWTQRDIGAVGVPGSASYANGTFSVNGSGADIWGTADAFQYVYQPLSGDGTIVARVASVQNVNVWTKAGLMIRATPDAGSPHASVFVTPGKGLAMQWRSASGGVSTSTAAAGAAPKFVRLARAGNNVTASYSSDGASWTAIGTATVTLPQDVLVGMPVASHDNTLTAAATFDNVSVGAAASVPAGLPSPWTQQDIGSVGVAGSATCTSGTFTIKGSGADIWGAADAFHYVYQPLNGDGTIVARVATVQNLNAWVKPGVMIRATTAAGSAHAAVYVTPGKGIALQWRSATGGTTISQQIAGAPPQWVRLVRTGDSIAASYSADGSSWTAIATVSVTLPQNVLAGLPMASHDNTQLASATFDSVAVTPAAAELPSPWTHQDIGSVGVAGSATYATGIFTVKGAGADIWGTADAFHYVYQTLSGDATIVARVTDVQNVYPWTKAGLMVRATTDPGSVYASIFVTPGKGIAVQYRGSAGGFSSSQSGNTAAAPAWVRLIRRGSAITAAYSTDGANWTTMSALTNVPLAGNVLVGLAVTSHDWKQTATATFDSVAINP